MRGNFNWLFFVALAGLSWGTYIPMVFYGGKELSSPAGQLGGRLTAVLCVGVAYFVLAVLIPLYLFLSKKHAWPVIKKTGLVFSGLAGIMGALGAIAVIFASKEAVDAARAEGLPENTYRMFIAPLIFSLAPIINTIVSLFWHPQPGKPWHFGLQKIPGRKFLLGLILVGIGVFFVLYAKEQMEPTVNPSSQKTTFESVDSLVWKYKWLRFVFLAGLAWGTYVPLIFYGGQELTGKPGDLGGRLMSILCVGLAYFLAAVVLPAGLMVSGFTPWPESFSATGLTFASMAGVAGAVGAICVIFASKAAVDSAKAANIPPATYRIFIAPLIFGLAPVINTLVSLLWHPRREGDFFHFGIEANPGWKLWLGILGVAAGSFLVLLSKEESESQKGTTPPQTSGEARAAGS